MEFQKILHIGLIGSGQSQTCKLMHILCCCYVIQFHTCNACSQASKAMMTEVDNFVEKTRPKIDSVTIERGRATTNLDRILVEIRVSKNAVPLVILKRINWALLDRKIEEDGETQYLVLRESLHKSQKLKNTQIKWLLGGRIKMVHIRNYNTIAMDILSQGEIETVRFFDFFENGKPGLLTDKLGAKLMSLVTKTTPINCQIEAEHILVNDFAAFARDLNSHLKGGSFRLTVRPRTLEEQNVEDKNRMARNRWTKFD